MPMRSVSYTHLDVYKRQYQRYLENQIRAVFGLEGTPIKITVRQKGDRDA